jgi:hypothetical protein
MISYFLLLIFSGQILLFGLRISALIKAPALHLTLSLSLFGISTWLIAEGLGFLGLLTTVNIELLLASLVALSVAYAWRAGWYLELRGKTVQLKLSVAQWALFSMALLLVVLALYSPPNNWDAQIYHLPRIFHWLSQKSVAHYLTPQLGQIAYPPLSAYFTLLLFAWAGSDLFFNLTQLFCLLISARPSHCVTAFNQ